MLCRVLILTLLLGAQGCRCEADSARKPASSASSKTRTQRRCEPASGFGEITLQPLGPDADDESEPGVERAFAVELGRVVRSADGHLWVPFLRTDGSVSRAAVLRLSEEGRGEELDLGQVVGASGPPRLAAGPGGVAIALEEGDASGGSYRVGQLLPKGEPNVHWLADVDADNDDSRAFDLAAGPGGQLLLVHDAWSRDLKRSEVWLDVVGQNGETLRHTRVSEELDAEGPLLAAHGGGLWLAFAALQPEDGGLRRTLLIRPLDSGGVPTARALSVPTRDSVRSFDLAPSHEGGVLLGLRTDARGLGGEGGALQLRRVGPDGSVVDIPVDEGGQATSTLGLFFDPRPQGGAPHGWLAVEGARGATLLAALAPGGAPLEAFSGDPVLGSAAVLLADAGHLLIATQRGRTVVLGRLQCVDRALPLTAADAG